PVGRAVTALPPLPLFELLGLTVVRRTDTERASWLQLTSRGRTEVIAITTGWGQGLERVWRSTGVEAIAADARWGFWFDGLTLRLVDARRTWSRDYLEFDLLLLGRETEAQSLLWAIAHADAMSDDPPRLDRAVDLSARHGVQVCRALGTGVLDALVVLLDGLTRGSRRPPALLWEQSLTVLYRVLFLLFAEARG